MLLVFGLLVNLNTFSQSASTNVVYSGFQACGGCAVCGADYWCIGIHGSWCGDIPNCDNRTFFDPVPPGNVVTNVTLNIWTGNCAGAAINASVAGNALPTAWDGNTGCWCDDNPCGMTSSTSGNFPCGLPNYNYGGLNNLLICVGTGEWDPSVCFSRVEVVLTYVTPDVITPSITPSGPTTFCPGGSVILNAGAGYSAYSWNTGAGTQTITATTTGTYTVTVTSITGCTSGTSSINVTVATPPSPTITGSSSYCIGSNTLLSTGSYNSYNWSTGSTGQTTTATIANNPVTVTVTDGNGCTGVSAPMNLTQNTLPTPTISGNLSYCTGSNTVLSTGAYSSYLWSTGSTGQTTNASVPNNPVTVSVTDGNGCSGVSPAVNVTANSLPTPVISGSLTYCPGAGSTLLDAGSYSSYLWSTGATSQTINATDANNPITVTVTDANGCTGSSPAVNVTLAANLNPTITGTLIYCSLSSAPLDAGSYSSYLWSTGATSQTINATIADNPITVTVTDAFGCTGSSAPVNVTLAPDLNPVISGTLAYCADTNTILDAGTYQTYLWSTGESTQTIIATTGGNPYTVTVSDANGCTGVSPSVNTVENELPGPVITGTLIYCNGYNTTLDAGTYNGYLWSTGATTQNVTVTTADNPITVTVTDANGCTGVSLPATVTLAPDLTPGITGSLSYCAGQTTLLDAGTYNAYIWSTGATTQTINATSADNPVTVTVTDANGCTGTATENLTEFTLPTPVITGNLDYCTGSNTLLDAGSYSSYLWSTGATTQTISATIANNPVTVTVTDSSGCSGNTSATVNQSAPAIMVDNVTHVDCYSNNTGSVSVSASGGISPYSYLWSTGDTIPSITGLFSGTYSVTITDNISCTSTTSMVVNQPPALNAATVVSDISCNNQNDGMISAVASGGTPNYFYLWSNSSTASSITNLSEGTYSLTVTDSNGCIDSVMNLTITNPPELFVSLTSTNPSCYNGNNGTATVSATGGTPPYNYQWTGGSSDSTVTGIGSGPYSVTVTDSHLCPVLGSVTLYNPVAISVTDTVLVNQYNLATIDITTTGGQLPYTYNWSTGATTEDLTDLSNGLYVVTIIDLFLCNSIDSILINIPELPLVIPSAISPNGDRINDDFEIKNIFQYSQVSIEIYNRWGDLIFKFQGTGMEYASPANRWDGTFNGKDAPMGSYVYIINLFSEEIGPFSGVVSVIK